jgi:hypothetical protein
MKRIPLLMGIIMLTSLLSCGKSGETPARITFLIGDVKVNGTPAQPGEMLEANAQIITGEQSSCDLKVGESLIRIKESSSLILAQVSAQGSPENTLLSLESGKMLCKPKKLLKDESFIVKTPTAVAGVRGTQFSVEADADKTTTFKVFEGEVKVAKRTAQLESNVALVIEKAKPLEHNQMVSITEVQAKEAEKKVDEALKKGGDEKAAVQAALEAVKEDLYLKPREVTAFKLEQFKEEREELSAISGKANAKAEPRNVEKIKPVPEGTLLVTRQEVYFVRNGKVEWEGKLITPPVKTADKLYIASGEWVFCAKPDGLVIWKKNFANDGRVEVQGDKLVVYAQGAQKRLDLENGEYK